MSYPGNPSLAEEIQQKILSTFQQTLDLAEEGRKEEALLGCDFVRRLDSQFLLAETLGDRLEATDGPVPVEDLRRELLPKEPPQGPPSGQPDPSVSEVDELFAALDEAEQDQPEEDVEVYELTEDDVDLDIQAEPGTNQPSAAEAADATETAGPQPDNAPPSEPEQSDSEPAAALDRESEERVDQLLAEGQSAFEENEYQSAIDAWSRIFLIDIDHPEANRRIDLARKLKAEVERKVEESYHDALSALDMGSTEVAAEGFRRVLAMQPGHMAAQEHLDRMAAGKSDAATEPQDSEEIEAPSAEDFRAELAELEENEELEPGFEPMVPPPPGEDPVEAPIEPLRPAPARRPSRRNAFIIAGLVLVIAVATAWFLRSNWTRFFPNAGEETVEPLRPKVDPIVRAQGLHLEGNTAMAISQLRRLPPAHPQYAEAQTLIAQWETVLEEDIQQDGPSEEQLTERDRLVAKGREAFANREFLGAEEFFSLAAQAAPLEEGTLALQAETVERLEPLRSEIEIFRQGEWTYALRSLWAKNEAEPGNPDIHRLMIDGYFNLGVRDLQRGDPVSAVTNFSEAAMLKQDDPEVQRLLSFARTYSQRSPDLLYRIFVKYVPFR